MVPQPRRRQRSIRDGAAGGRRGVPRPLRLALRWPRARGRGGLRGNDPEGRGLVREGAAVAPAQETRRDGSVALVQFRLLPRSKRGEFRRSRSIARHQARGSPFNPSRGRWSDASSEPARCPAIYERSTRGPRGAEGKTTQEGAELARRGWDADVGGSNPARGAAGGRGEVGVDRRDRLGR